MAAEWDADDAFSRAYARLQQPMEDGTSGEDALGLHPPPEWPDENRLATHMQPPQYGDETVMGDATVAAQLDGDLWKYCAGAAAGVRWQRCRFQLAHGKLAYSSTTSGFDSDASGGVIDLSNAVVKRAHRREYCISITCSSGGGTETFVAADTEMEYQRWLSTLTTVAGMHSSGVGVELRSPSTPTHRSHYPARADEASSLPAETVVDANSGYAGVSLASSNGWTNGWTATRALTEYPIVPHQLPAVHPAWTPHPESEVPPQQFSSNSDVDIARIQSLVRRSRDLHATSSSEQDASGNDATPAGVVGQLHVTIKESDNLQAQVPQVELRFGGCHQVTPQTLPITQQFHYWGAHFRFDVHSDTAPAPQREAFLEVEANDLAASISLGTARVPLSDVIQAGKQVRWLALTDDGQAAATAQIRVALEFIRTDDMQPEVQLEPGLQLHANAEADAVAAAASCENLGLHPEPQPSQPNQLQPEPEPEPELEPKPKAAQDDLALKPEPQPQLQNHVESVRDAGQWYIAVADGGITAELETDQIDGANGLLGIVTAGEPVEIMRLAQTSDGRWRGQLKGGEWISLVSQNGDVILLPRALGSQALEHQAEELERQVAEAEAQMAERAQAEEAAAMEEEAAKLEQMVAKQAAQLGMSVDELHRLMDGVDNAQQSEPEAHPPLPLAAAATEDVRADENSTDHRVGVQPQPRASVDSVSHSPRGSGPEPEPTDFEAEGQQLRSGGEGQGHRQSLAPRAHPEPASLARWRYVDDSGLVQGPFGTNQIRDWFAKGYLKGDRQVSCDDDATEDKFSRLDSFPQLTSNDSELQPDPEPAQNAAVETRDLSTDEEDFEERYGQHSLLGGLADVSEESVKLELQALEAKRLLIEQKKRFLQERLSPKSKTASHTSSASAGGEAEGVDSNDEGEGGDMGGSRNSSSGSSGGGSGNRSRRHRFVAAEDDVWDSPPPVNPWQMYPDNSPAASSASSPVSRADENSTDHRVGVQPQPRASVDGVSPSPRGSEPEPEPEPTDFEAEGQQLRSGGGSPAQSDTSVAQQRHWVVAATAGADVNHELQITVSFGLTQCTEVNQATHIRLNWDELLIVAESLGCNGHLLAAAPRSGEATLEDFNSLFARLLVGQSFDARANFPVHHAVELLLSEYKARTRLVDGLADPGNNGAAAHASPHKQPGSAVPVPHIDQDIHANDFSTTQHTQTWNQPMNTWSRTDTVAARGMSSDEDSDEALGESGSRNWSAARRRRRRRSRNLSTQEEAKRPSNSTQHQQPHVPFHPNAWREASAYSSKTVAAATPDREFATVDTVGGNTERQRSVAVHAGVYCDASGMYPIVGTRYKDVRRGRNYDLCEAEFEKLSEGEKVFFRAIQWPEDGSDSDAPVPDDGGAGW